MNSLKQISKKKQTQSKSILLTTSKTRKALLVLSTTMKTIKLEVFTFRIASFSRRCIFATRSQLKMLKQDSSCYWQEFNPNKIIVCSSTNYSMSLTLKMLSRWYHLICLFSSKLKILLQNNGEDSLKMVTMPRKLSFM